MLKIIVDRQDHLAAARAYVDYRKAQAKRRGYDRESLPVMTGVGVERGQCDNCGDPLWVENTRYYNYCGDCKPVNQKKNRTMGFDR